jgi:rhamnulokinase
MNTYYLAVDIGASSGRHMLGYLQGGKIVLEEVYRFPNKLIQKNGHLFWDLDKLFQEILNGLKICEGIGKIPAFMGIDTWGVDFVLLDKEDKRIGDSVSYRDKRTEGMDKLVSKVISQELLYQKTGIQKQSFNSIYQLMAIAEQAPEQLVQAETFLLVPDYFHFLLTGVKKTEYTNATTTQLVNAETKNWDTELIDVLEFPQKLFTNISMPGTAVGKFSEHIRKEVGFSCKVLLPPTHDTASAVLAIPVYDSKDFIYISSGTWSLMGIERMNPSCSSASMKANFTNEGGYDFRFRYLKNIMGLWMIQSVKKEMSNPYSFDELCNMALQEKIESTVDCNNPRFLAPESMTWEIKKYCSENNLAVPNTDAELVAVIYKSLAKYYASTIREIEVLECQKFSKIYIVGGGSNAGYLNQLTAKYSQKKVYAGPAEATAIGNIVSQMLSQNEFETVDEARKCIYKSFKIKEY